MTAFRGALALLICLCATEAHSQSAAMIYGNDAVSTPDAVTLPEPTEHWFTQGNGVSINGTQVPSYWVNKVGGELSSLIQGACAQSLAMSSYTQINTCILAIDAQIAALETPVPHGLATFTGNTSWTVPAGVTTVDATICGAGGSGGGGVANGLPGAGGGAGGYAIGVIAVTPGSQIVISGGSGFSGGSAGGGNGNSGGNTTISISGTTMLGATGGGAGAGGSSGTASGGAGGAGSAPGLGSGVLGAETGMGGNGSDGGSTGGGTNYFFPGNGGSSIRGGGGRASTAPPNAASNGAAPCSGGGGGYLYAVQGGSGANGLVTIRW